MKIAGISMPGSPSAATRKRVEKHIGGPLYSSELFNKTFCCIGFLVVLQNVFLLRWGSPSICPDVEPVEASADEDALGQTEHELQGAAPEEAKPTGSIPSSPPPIVPSFEGGVVTMAPMVFDRPPAPAPINMPPLPPAPKVSLEELWKKTESGGNADSAKGKLQMRPDKSLRSVPREKLRLFGEAVPPTAKICVGFGTVSRKKDYVFDTIKCMFGLSGAQGCSVSEEERSQLVVLMHLADFDIAWVQATSKKMQEEFPDLIKRGLLHAIHAPQELYPELELCPPNCYYRDDPHRVKWRSKQNVDYAFLMYYAEPLAPYYLQIEDDLSFAPNWVQKILTYWNQEYPPGWLSKENTPWRLIDFSELGFIGKAVQSNELVRLAQFLLLFYDQMPCDLLLGEWMKSMTQGKRLEYWKTQQSLFQHVGVFRSLGGYQPLQENRFGNHLFDNPPGVVFANMTGVPTFEARYAYWPGGNEQDRSDECDLQTRAPRKRCFYWAKTVMPGDHITLVFNADVPNVMAALVEFGAEKHEKDIIEFSDFQVAGTSQVPGKTGEALCGPFHTLMSGNNEKVLYWEKGVSSPAELPVNPVRCLRVVAKTQQAAWAIVWQFLVRTTDKR